MTWLATVFIGLLTGALGLLVSGFIASLAIDWYRISSFEGGSGYFMVIIALLGGAAGGVIGLVAARAIAGSANPGFLKALAVACGIVLVLGTSIGGVARLLADVSPRIDGETLFVMAELRWPAADTTDPASYPGLGFTRFSTGTRGHVVRKSETGPLFVDQARREDGRWIVTGVAPIFTERGDRILDLGIGDKTLGGFIIPLAARPGAKDREWSAWMPRARPGAPPLPDMFTVRYRVVRRSETIRTEAIGPFEIATASGYFYNVSSSSRLASHSTFTISHKGKPVAGLEEATGIALVPGAVPALLVTAGEHCQLLTEDRGRPKVEPLTFCSEPSGAHLLTDDPEQFRAAHQAEPVPGWIDRSTFAIRGVYQLGNGVFDTRTLAHAATTYPDDPNPINGLPPITLSPDGLSYVWFTFRHGSEADPVLGITDWKTDTHYSLAVDRPRMRYNDYHRLDPAWVAHHFTWLRGDNGHDRLVARRDFEPLPYHGELTLNPDGEYQNYTIRPCGEPMRQALVEFLVKELGAERMPGDPNNNFYVVLKIEGKPFKLAVVDSDVTWVSIDMDKGDGDPKLMARVAERLDAALATGKYDRLFGKTE